MPSSLSVRRHDALFLSMGGHSLVRFGFVALEAHAWLAGDRMLSRVNETGLLPLRITSQLLNSTLLPVARLKIARRPVMAMREAQVFLAGRARLAQAGSLTNVTLRFAPPSTQQVRYPMDDARP